jgi:hypothetical protein
LHHSNGPKTYLNGDGVQKRRRDDTMNKEKEEIKSKLDKYMGANIPVHIVFRIDEKDYRKKRNGSPMPRFYNGFVIGKKSEDIYVIDERKIGTTYFLVDDVYSVVVYEKEDSEIRRNVIEKNGFKLGEGVSPQEINILRNLNIGKD